MEQALDLRKNKSLPASYSLEQPLDLSKNKSLPASCNLEQAPGKPPSSPTIGTPELNNDVTGWQDMYQPPSTSPDPPRKTADSSDTEDDNADGSTCYACYTPVCDDVDGARTASFLNTVKAVVVHLLDKVVQLYRKEQCYGCQVDHPSQMQHECLFEMPEYFLERNYDEVVKRLWTDRFIPAIRGSLHSIKLHVSERRIFGAAEAILHNLRSTRRYEVKINKIYEKLVENDESQLKNLDDAWDFWQREEEFETYL